MAEQARLEKRVRELENIVKAAQEFLDTIELAKRTGAVISMTPVQWQALYKLQTLLKNEEV